LQLGQQQSSLVQPPMEQLVPDGFAIGTVPEGQTTLEDAQVGEVGELAGTQHSKIEHVSHDDDDGLDIRFNPLGQMVFLHVLI